MHHRSGSWVKGHYRNGTWVTPHKRSETMVSDSIKKDTFISKGKRYLYSDDLKKISDLNESECRSLSYHELKKMIKDGYHSEILLYVANNKEEELFSSMSYDELLKLKKKGSYHCINYDTLLKYLDNYRKGAYSTDYIKQNYSRQEKIKTLVREEKVREKQTNDKENTGVLARIKALMRVK